MNATLLILSLIAGLLLGGFYFGGLWMTVRRLATTSSAALWLVSSFLIRATIVITGFFFVSGGRWEQIVACLAGFLIARSLIIRFTRASAGPLHTRLPTSIT